MVSLKQNIHSRVKLVEQMLSVCVNDHIVGWKKLNLLSHPNVTLAPQARQARASGEILNYLLSL